MKNSLKLVMGLLLGVLFVGQANSAGEAKNPNRERDKFRVIMTGLQNNKHIYPFIPTDLRGIKNSKGVEGRGSYGTYICDDNGQVVPAESMSGGCYTYQSSSTRTYWTILFVTKPGSTTRVKKIFKQEGSQLKLWAQFDPKNDVNTYASNEARKFAGNQSGGNTNVVKENERSPSVDIIKDAQNADADELVKKGVDLIKGFRF